MNSNEAREYLLTLKQHYLHKDGYDLNMIFHWNKERVVPVELNLSNIDLSGLMVLGMNFSLLNFYNSNLSKTVFHDCRFIGTSFENSNIQEVHLWGSYLSNANLKNASLKGSNIQSTTFRWCNLKNTDFSDVELGSCNIDSNLNLAKGLDKISHLTPSTVSIKTILKMKDNFSEVFLRGCGLQDKEIEYFKNRKDDESDPYNSCFISYSTKDEEFVVKLHSDLQNKGIRCWKWNCNAKTGNDLWEEIDQAIHKYDKLLLVASKVSLTSPAVNREIERAIRREDELYDQKNKGMYTGSTNVLFPIRLDDYIFENWENPRKADVTKKVIADAREWKKEAEKYTKLVDKLSSDLKK